MPREYKLRDGSATFDKRLDRLIDFDPRSRRFNVMHRVTERVPRSFTWRCEPHFNQGKEGACVGFGCTHELVARPAEVTDPNVNAVYAKMIYKEAQKIDPWPGERYAGTSVLAGVRTIHRLGWISGYFWSFSLDELIFGVGYRGPAVMGLRWFKDMQDTNPDTGFIKVKGSMMGAHCVLCKGVNIKKEFFTIHNSWGSEWGVNGDCYISFKDMEKLLKMDGEAVFFTGRRSVLP